MEHVIVVGAGQAGASCVAKLRAEGFEGQITLIGSEAALPYQRPPLSKKYLLGEFELERLYLRPQSFYEQNNITLRLGQSVDAIDPVARTVSIGGETLTYSDLVFATGSSPRHLPASIGGNLQRVYTMRDLADADAMAPEFIAGRHVLIVGGGYIGLEAAAVAAAKGLNVTLVEMADRILQRVAAPETADYFRALHQSNGVKILEDTGLKELIGDGEVSGAVLSDGTQLDVDFVVVGVGIDPNTTLAKDAGLKLENGIATDAKGQTSHPRIWAAGDCASFPYHGHQIRLESVPNAIDQAEVVAANILGANRDYHAKPWFWSDQYDVKLQIAGLNTGYESVVKRDHGEGSQSVWYYTGDQLMAVDAMNAPRDYMIGKRLIEAGKSVPAEVVADAAADLKPFLKA
ncbi:NAD(P)/FAD-dependent oxidoreductase [Cognatishimia maritima]|uniref:3-phenylpropionate/trans-cinnamate dioxygenase ferredoxin reductase subunit n=1 Tax=Cognatishimia maritima TaxID=870908 RepID=A0A1M5NMB6_9RHOB|nr:FAD-dependent oxidoreductase [Cognatishimia maritima]SHG90734.1 3-phenylpropionate/trans-cinnamate dioxygenase ferredoxin reductase subunit [Cognatishimia maritima]